MVCPYCKEEIKEGAVKCKNCGEFTKHRIRVGPLLRTLFQILIPILSLSLAYLELQSRKVAEVKRDEAQATAVAAREEAEQTMAILEMIPKEIIHESALSGIEPNVLRMDPGFREIERGNFVQAEKIFQRRLEENPTDEIAKKGLATSKVLKKIKRE